MDRDAPATPAPLSALDAVPPHEWEWTRKVAFVGLGLIVVAALIGVIAALAGSLPSLASTLRLALVTAGAITVGVAVSLRPDRYHVWLLAAAASLIAYFGTPSHWDSYRLVFGVFTGVALVAALFTSLVLRWRYILGSVLLLYHFVGIFMATVAPSPSPWLAEQVYYRFYTEYLQFVYLTNAYHFYAPQPGPASVDVFLLKTEVGEETLPDGTKRKKYDYRWLVLPQRQEGTRDPLGLTFIRRLSLTHHSAQTSYETLLNPQSVERLEVQERRKELASKLGGQYYPYHPLVPIYSQYQAPRSDTMNYVLPSYAQHVILEYTADAAAAGKSTVKIYRLEHETLSVAEFNNKIDPFHPATFRPYFLGEYGFRPDRTDPERKRVRIELIDPQEKMLYWLLPVLPRESGTFPAAASRKDFYDYLSAHALGVPLEDLEKEPHASRALNWSLLR